MEAATGLGFAPNDLGTFSVERCDATPLAIRLAETLRQNQQAFGVLICGSGQAMAMTANRYAHIRAALCTNPTMARLSREHNDANALVLGADVTDKAGAEDCLQAFLSTKFLGGRYVERLRMLEDLGGV